LTALKNPVFLIGEEILRNANNDTSGDYAAGGYAACHYAAGGYAAGGYAACGYATGGYAAAYAFVVLKENTRNAGLHIT